MPEGNTQVKAVANHYRDALSELIELLGREITNGKYDDRQRVILGRCERWTQEKLRRADDLSRAPKQPKKRRAPIEDDED